MLGRQAPKDAKMENCGADASTGERQTDAS
jgi:hypothetical protein